MKKILDFIKYNNAMVLILAAVFLFSAGAFAQTNAGQEIIGKKQAKINGTDNALLLAADLDKMEMDFKIEKIEEDGKMYYATYTFLDLDKINNAWQYQLKEKIRKVSKKLDGDLGEYLVKEFHEQYEARIKELKEEQAKAEANGEEKRVEITEYSGLIGKTLDLAATVIPGYEPIKKTEIASPEEINKTYRTNDRTDNPANAEADNLAEVYNEYIAEHAGEINQLNAGESDVIAPQEIPAAETASTTEGDLKSADIVGANETIATTTEPIEPEVEVIELPE